MTTDKIKLKNRIAGKKWLQRHGHPDGIIYKWTNVVTGDTYIGSTRNPLSKRWHQAVAAANAGKGGLLNENIREWGKECFEKEILFECSPGDDLRQIETDWILDLLPSLNRGKPKKDDNFSYLWN